MVFELEQALSHQRNGVGGLFQVCCRILFMHTRLMPACCVAAQHGLIFSLIPCTHRVLSQSCCPVARCPVSCSSLPLLELSECSTPATAERQLIKRLFSEKPSASLIFSPSTHGTAVLSRKSYEVKSQGKKTNGKQSLLLTAFRLRQI